MDGVILAVSCGSSYKKDEQVSLSSRHFKGWFTHLHLSATKTVEAARNLSQRRNTLPHWCHLSRSPGAAYNLAGGFVVFASLNLCIIYEERSLITLSKIFRANGERMVCKILGVFRGYPMDGANVGSRRKRSRAVLTCDAVCPTPT